MKMRRIWSGWLVIGMLALSVCYVNKENADAASVSDLKEQQEEAEKEAEELRQAKQELEVSLGDMNSNLYNLSASMNELQEQIEQKEQEIAEAEELLAETEALSRQQYDDMKLRIQFMYENSSSLSWTSLLQAGSLPELLNRAQYISEITDYDRERMAEYQKTVQDISAYKAQLEQENQALAVSKEAQEREKNTLLSEIAGMQAGLEEQEEEIAKRQQEAGALAEKIAAMEAYEKQLEEQKTKADAAKAEEIEKQETGSAGTSKTPITPEIGEEELLAALIFCESGGESYESQLAVGSVVLNRVNSPYFADTITGVIYQSGQFTPAASGRLAVVLENGLTTDSCRKAAKETLGGKITGNWLFFCVNNGTIKGTVIGKQVFY